MIKLKTEANPPKRGGWLRKLIWIGGVLVVLVVALYFVATSAAFFKGVVLPRVGAALNADVTVADAQISPCSQVILRDLKVTPKSAEPLLTAGEVRARYRLLAILRGNIAVDEVVVVNPTITLVQKADGTSNLDPILKSRKPAGKKESLANAKSSASAPPALDIKSVKLENATVRQTKHLKEGGRDVLEMANLNLTVRDLKNGQSGKLGLAASMTMDKAAQAGTPASTLSAKLGGGFTFALAQDLQPTSLNGNTTLTVERATGALAELAALVVKLDAEASPTEIKQLAVRFNKAGDSLGELRVSGPFDAAKLEGKLKVELAGVDKKLLNLAGAANGLDFGSTAVSSAGDLELARGGDQITASGQLSITRFQVTREGQTTPALDLACNYNVVVDNTAKSALLKSLNLAGTQNQRPLLQASLTAPMTVAWGDTANAVGDSALNVNVTALDLADWKPFLGDLAPAGKLDLTARLLSQQAGQQLQFEAKAGLDNLVVRAGTNRYAGLGLTVEARGQATDLKQFKLGAYRAQLAQHGAPVLSAEGTGNCDTAAKTADAGAKVVVTLPNLVKMLSLPDASLSSGTADMQVRLTHKGSAQTVTGRVLVTNLTGAFGPTKFQDFGLDTDLEVMKNDQKVQLRKAAGKLASAGQAGGSFEATGNYDLATTAGDVNLKLAGLNQHALRPFLEAALGDKKLVSVAVNSTVTASRAANGDASAKADLQLTNLVVNDPKGTLPSTPLEARVQADAALGKQIAQVRQLQLTLTPTDRAKNQLGLTGTVDYSKTNAVTGSLKLAAEALDVTRYYDLFAGDTKAATTPASSTPAGDPTQEPDALNLPFKDFTFDASIGRLYLREVDIANLQATAKLNGGHVVVKPCQLTLNGAPVTATVDADLGVPGFKYDLAFNADKVPLAPLVNSFVPDRKGQIGGTTTAGAQIKGAGVTGASLQKNLTGQFNLLTTNMNLSVENVRSPLLNSVINVIVGIPDLIRDPTAAVGSLLSRLAGAPAKRTGWADQLTAAPIDTILVRGGAGSGRVNLQTAEIRSTAFQAVATGGIGLAAILTNSTIQIPLSVSLSRALADKIGLVTPDIPTNQAYVALPDFVSLKGTVGSPKPDINKLALVGLAARTGAGLAKNISGAAGGQAGGILGAVGNLLGGGAPPASATGTNAPGSTNRAPTEAAGNLLRGLGGLLGGSQSSQTSPAAPTQPRVAPANAPATNSPPQQINLLDLFGRPKK